MKSRTPLCSKRPVDPKRFDRLARKKCAWVGHTRVNNEVGIRVRVVDPDMRGQFIEVASLQKLHLGEHPDTGEERLMSEWHVALTEDGYAFNKGCRGYNRESAGREFIFEIDPRSIPTAFTDACLARKKEPFDPRDK